MDLTKVVAKEDNHVYEEFFSGDVGGGGGRLVVYLERIREVGMLGLKSGGSAFQIKGI